GGACRVITVPVGRRRELSCFKGLPAPSRNDRGLTGDAQERLGLSGPKDPPQIAPGISGGNRRDLAPLAGEAGKVRFNGRKPAVDRKTLRIQGAVFRIRGAERRGEVADRGAEAFHLRGGECLAVDKDGEELSKRHRISCVRVAGKFV